MRDDVTESYLNKHYVSSGSNNNVFFIIIQVQL